MKRKLQYAKWSVIYYFGVLEMKFMELWFNLKYIIKHKKKPRKISEKEMDGLKELLKELREKD